MNKELAKAIGARDRFLKENPHLEDYQSEIYLKLSNLDNPTDRMTLLGAMIKDNIARLNNALNCAKDYLASADK